MSIPDPVCADVVHARTPPDTIPRPDRRARSRRHPRVRQARLHPPEGARCRCTRLPAAAFDAVGHVGPATNAKARPEGLADPVRRRLATPNNVPKDALPDRVRRRSDSWMPRRPRGLHGLRGARQPTCHVADRSRFRGRPATVELRPLHRSGAPTAPRQPFNSHLARASAVRRPPTMPVAMYLASATASQAPKHLVGRRPERCHRVRPDRSAEAERPAIHRRLFVAVRPRHPKARWSGGLRRTRTPLVTTAPPKRRARSEPHERATRPRAARCGTRETNRSSSPATRPKASAGSRLRPSPR